MKCEVEPMMSKVSILSFFDKASLIKRLDSGKFVCNTRDK